MIKISIVFPVFNAIEYTKKCLYYLKETLCNVNENVIPSIVVLDDGSSDGTSDWIKKHFPEIHLCSGNGNLWWSGGVNVGTRYALDILKADYILLWNNDIRPSTDYFNHLSQILLSNPPNNIILSKIFIENKSEPVIFSLGGHFNPYTGKHSLIGFGRSAESYVPSNLEINWFPGMGTTIHKSVFEKIGLFDEEMFPQYKGDADFALRSYKAGFRMTLYPELLIWNDRDNTGFSNNKSFLIFLRSLVSKKSNSNIYRDFLFYRRHGKSIWVYTEILKKYAKHIGGFLKWKFLGFFNKKRTHRH